MITNNHFKFINVRVKHTHFFFFLKIVIMPSLFFTLVFPVFFMLIFIFYIFTERDTNFKGNIKTFGKENILY